MKTRKMERIDWAFNWLMRNPFYFVFGICIVFGVIANEAWLKLKYPERNMYDSIFLKFIVATFVGVLVHSFYSWRKFDKEYEYLPLLVSSYLYRSFAKWVSVSLFPLVTRVIQNVAVQALGMIINIKKPENTTNKKEENDEL